MQKSNQVPLADNLPSEQPGIQGEGQVENKIDLNLLFPDEDADLNVLFPESDLKTLLKKIQRNRSDIKKMTTRFEDELSNDTISTKSPNQKQNE